MSSLTKDERETVILMDDGSDWAIVSTWQRPLMTRLDKNPLAERVESWTQGRSKGARYRIPARMVSFRAVDRNGRADSGNLLKGRKPEAS